MTNKKSIQISEALYRKRLRDSERIEKLKPLIEKAHKILRHTKVGKGNKNNN